MSNKSIYKDCGILMFIGSFQEAANFKEQLENIWSNPYYFVYAKLIRYKDFIINTSIHL